MIRIHVFSFFLFCLVLSPLFVKAQTQEENQTKYLYGRNLLKEGRFQAAAQVFLPLTSESATNSFSKPAAYLYALASLKSGDTEAAKAMCLQTLQRYPEWNQREEVYYLLANTYFEQSKPRLALQFLDKAPSLKKDAEQLKENYLSSVSPIDTLIALQRDYPSDVQMAKLLAKRVNDLPYNEKNKMLFDFLVQEFKLDMGEVAKRRNTVLKTNYNIAVLFPFQLNEIDPKISKRTNQFVLDFYEGIRMAVDSLKAKGINVQLFPYDTEKDTSILRSIIGLPEMKSMDMIIGPVFPSQVLMVTAFANKNNILNINPFSANSSIIARNEFSYLFQSTLEWQAGTAARYANQYFRHDSSYIPDYISPKRNPRTREREPITMDKKKVIILFGNDLKDSLMAVYHKDSCIANKLEVIHFEKITRSKIELLKVILGDTMKLGNSNHVFASTSDEVVAANIMSLMEISRQNTPLITRSDWLNFELIAFSQFEKRNVFFIHSDYYDYDNPLYQKFKTAWIYRSGIYPSIYSLQGFELMMYFGKALGSFGNYFKYGLDEQGYTKGMIFKGYDYSYSYSNKYVPLTRFRDKNLILVNGKE